MSPKKKQLGNGATVSVNLKYLHPGVLVDQLFPNRTARTRLGRLVVVGRNQFKVSNKQQLCSVLQHPDHYCASPTTLVKYHKFHAVERWLRVDIEGDPDCFYEKVTAEDAQPEPINNDDGRPTNAVDLPPQIRTFRGRNKPLTREELQRAKQQQVVEIDDDNEPVPENDERKQKHKKQPPGVMKKWHTNVSLCERAKVGVPTDRARIMCPELREKEPKTITRLEFFEAMIPKDHVVDVMIPGMNEILKKPLTYGEFLRWLGVWLLIASEVGWSRHDYWKTTGQEDPFDGPMMRMNEFMSRDRFDNILNALTFTDQKPPSYNDKFWEVRQLIDAWNKNMDITYRSSSFVCVDESMSKWVNMWTCPGFILCPRKPWEAGNEYHDIADKEPNIIFRLELKEGEKDKCPQQEKKKKFVNRGGKTVGLLLRLTEPLHGRGVVVIGDSGFCVVEAMIQIGRAHV